MTTAGASLLAPAQVKQLTDARAFHLWIQNCTFRLLPRPRVTRVTHPVPSLTSSPHRITPVASRPGNSQKTRKAIRELCRACLLQPAPMHGQPAALRAARGPQATQPGADPWQAQGHNSRAFDPRLIHALKRAKHWKKVRQLITQARDADAVELCTALHAAQNLLGPSVLRLSSADERVLCKFVNATLWRILKRTDELPQAKRGQALANTLTSLARLHIRPSSTKLGRLAAEALTCVPRASKQSVANTLMALALLDATDAEAGDLLEALAGRALQLVRAPSCVFLIESIRCQRSAAGARPLSPAPCRWNGMRTIVRLRRGPRASKQPVASPLMAPASRALSSERAPRQCVSHPRARVSATLTRVQVERFSFEEFSHVAWALARLRSERADPAPFLFTGLTTWPRLLKGAAQDPAAMRGTLPKNLAQLAFGYAKARDDVSVDADTTLDETLLTFVAALPSVLLVAPRLSPQGLAMVRPEVWRPARTRMPPSLIVSGAARIMDSHSLTHSHSHSRTTRAAGAVGVCQARRAS